jgi:hypothetical protein
LRELDEERLQWFVWLCKKNIGNMDAERIKSRFQGKGPMLRPRTRWFRQKLVSNKKTGKNWQENEKETRGSGKD